MPNYADKETDRLQKSFEHHIATIYQNAWRSVDKSLGEFLGTYAVKDQEMQKKLAAGEITKDYYTAWKQNQIGQAERWKSIRSNIAKTLTNANQIAADYVNSKTPGIYSLNANYTAYEIEKGASIDGQYVGVSFNLVNEDTIKEILEDKNHTEFRVLSIDPERDYNWNYNKIQNALASGILSGDSTLQMSNRFYNVMQNNYAAAIRNARTAITSAQNAGKQRTFEEATKMGIEIQKEWIATLDNRTRDEHQKMDGVRVPYSEPFPIGLMYPGDPSGEPALVYNCRCTMRAIMPGINSGRNVERFVRDEFNNSTKVQDTTYIGIDNTESYKEWLKSKFEGEYDESMSSLEDMMAMFRPRYGDEELVESIYFTPLKLTKVINSQFNMYISSDEATRKNTAIGTTEVLLRRITEKYKSDVTIPRIVIVNMDKIGHATAGAGYNQSNDTIYVNSMYNTFEKIIQFLTDRDGEFANNSADNILVHELGHKKYHDTIINLAKSKNVTYNKVAKDVHEAMLDYLHTVAGSSQIEDFVIKEISRYASSGLDEIYNSEIFAESFTILNREQIANDLWDILLKGGAKNDVPNV